MSPKHVPNQLWVGGLPHDFTETDIDRLFGKYGKLTNVDLRTGWAFLTFSDQDDATDAQRSLPMILCSVLRPSATCKHLQDPLQPCGSLYGFAATPVVV
jgi:RNA recognition motif-containing protein